MAYHSQTCYLQNANLDILEMKKWNVELQKWRSSFNDTAVFTAYSTDPIPVLLVLEPTVFWLGAVILNL